MSTRNAEGDIFIEDEPFPKTVEFSTAVKFSFNLAINWELPELEYPTFTTGKALLHFDQG